MISINKSLGVVLVYPFLLLVPTFLGIEAFFITNPYFFLCFIFILGYLFILKKKENISRVNILVLVLFFLIILAVSNFVSIRYSGPIFFVTYVAIWFIFLNSLENKYVNFSNLIKYYWLVLIVSMVFLFLDNGYTTTNRFVGFIGSPTIFSGFLVSFFMIASIKKKVFSLSFIFLFCITFYLVYLTKTRLLLILLLVFPILKLFDLERGFFTKKLIFFLVYFSTLLIYPLYNIIIEYFPQLVSIRYGKERDASFGLRNYLFQELKLLFSDGTLTEKFFGRGNEFSRLYVQDLMGFDLMPHNDYMRLLIDWGVMGFLIFSYILYKVAIKNNLSLYLSLVYMVLFYSNTIFNLFLISMLLVFYHNINNQKSVVYA